ncbi:hypothetical protein CKO11_03585 [Rhodobacter sp. TJ_12]|uniref:hypothetical protein n=1 Tax=Rhodobacter sp. TJ_12 TaxID=2029399 RepID=UPI001CBBA975|nr:hypothetical protein [Rhodobacter sp. TJ_12]MBZ4021539.1 hypothetical protein [Rhodobacter sp. TJ_12]
MTPQEKARVRLRHFLAHCAEHMQDHAREIEGQYAQIGDPEICGLMERAVVEMARANAALEVVLARLDDSPIALRGGSYALNDPAAAPKAPPARTEA